jgi:lipopolysaccharide transport system ATP-binding protein
MPSVIQVENVTKIYPLYNKPSDRMREALSVFRKKKYHRDFYALNDISFEVERGETIGIIGKNGSGKSTLLKIITGVLTPTTGSVKVNGKVSALLELGAGFNPELSGIENVYFNGMIMGYSRKEMDEKIDNILAFADIGDFVNQPVKMYSSGMFVRLAFSVATNVNPDILIVDEALSVGDMFFQAKCMTKMKKMIDNGDVTLLFVSHSMDAVKALCRRAILLSNGKVLMNGKSVEVMEKYFEMKVSSEQNTVNKLIDDKPASNHLLANSLEQFLIPSESFKQKSSFQRIMNGKAEFLNVILLDETENEISNVKFGQTVILRMVLKAHEDIYALGFGYHIRDKNGVEVIYGSSSIEEKRLYNVKAGETHIVDWKFELRLMQGTYTIACVTSIPIDAEIGKVDFCDFIPIACQFEVERRYPVPSYGLVYLDNEVNVRRLG